MSRREVARHVLVLGDQLTTATGPLADADPADTAIVLIESTAWARRRRYHRQKLVLVFAAMRHFGEARRGDGFTVHDYRVDAYEDGLEQHLEAYPASQLEVMEPADLGVAESIRATVEGLGGRLRVVPNGLWLSDAKAFDDWAGKRRSLRMEHWYRLERRRTGWLMRTPDGAPAGPGDPDAVPEGGEWNLDRENRRAVPAGMTFPPVPRVEADDVTREVIEWVDATFPDHPGSTASFGWPVTRAAAVEALDAFIGQRLADFGPYEDALVDGQRTLAHSLLSAPLNIGLLSAREACEAALSAYAAQEGERDAEGAIPLSSVEGFVRQLLGWREFMRHVYRRRMPGLRDADGLGSDPLPDFYWTGETRMRCVADAVGSVVEDGHAHHIQRLMVLGNWALLAGVEARQLDEWFLELFVDAFDWVVIPNVMGMSQWADRSFTSKPYVSGGAYIDRMSDHCGRCPYDPRRTTGEDACPFSTLYWDFIDRHAEDLRRNARMGLPVRSWQRRDEEDRQAIRDRAEVVRRMAADGDL